MIRSIHSRREDGETVPARSGAKNAACGSARIRVGYMDGNVWCARLQARKLPLARTLHPRRETVSVGRGDDGLVTAHIGSEKSESKRKHLLEIFWE